MKTILLIVFGAISLVTGLIFLLRALHIYKNGRRAKRVLSAIQVYTIGVFASVVLVFIPIYYTNAVRADRAMLHDNLCSWEKLSELDRQKD